MDYFRKAQAKKIGHGGVRCPCCNDYHNFGNHAKKKRGLSSAARAALKKETAQETWVLEHNGLGEHSRISVSTII